MPRTSTKLYVHEFGFLSGGSDPKAFSLCSHYAFLKWCQCTTGSNLLTSTIQLFYIAIFSEELDFVGESEVSCSRIHRSLTWLAVRNLWILRWGKWTKEFTSGSQRNSSKPFPRLGRCFFRGFTFSDVLLFHKTAACVDDAVKVVIHDHANFGLLGSTYQLNLEQ